MKNATEKSHPRALEEALMVWGKSPGSLVYRSSISRQIPKPSTGGWFQNDTGLAERKSLRNRIRSQAAWFEDGALFHKTQSSHRREPRQPCEAPDRAPGRLGTRPVADVIASPSRGKAGAG